MGIISLCIIENLNSSWSACAIVISTGLFTLTNGNDVYIIGLLK